MPEQPSREIPVSITLSKVRVVAKALPAENIGDFRNGGGGECGAGDQKNRGGEGGGGSRNAFCW